MAPSKLSIAVTKGYDANNGSLKSGSSIVSGLSSEGETVSPTSSLATSIDDVVNAQGGQAGNAQIPGVQLVASPQAYIIVNGVQYASGEIRTMLDQVLQARGTRELPLTRSMALDAAAIVQDHGFLTQLRDIRGDPAVPPSEEYIALRVEVARQIRERDDDLDVAENLRAARERVDTYLHVANIERRYFELTQEIAQRRGIQSPSQADMESITDEIIGVVEHAVENSVVDATSPIRANANRLATTAGTLDNSANAINAALGIVARLIDQIHARIESLDMIIAAQANGTNANGVGYNGQAFNGIHPIVAQALYNVLQARQAQAQAPAEEQDQGDKSEGKRGRGFRASVKALIKKFI